MSQNAKIALVTGANQGIGFETVRQLAERGITVFLAGRSIKSATTAAAKLNDDGLKGVYPIQIDVTKANDRSAAARQIDRRFGRLDILVNNAGMTAPDGTLMESTEGCSATDRILRCGRRQSVFRSYPYPLMDRPNLTVLTGALVTRITFTDKRATGIELFYDRRLRHIEAGSEVIVSLGAVQTPKVLMQSGIGNQAELERFDIPVVQHLPGVGQNLQDYPNN